MVQSSQLFLIKSFIQFVINHEVIAGFHLYYFILNYKIDYLGFIYDDPIVSTSVIRQKPFIISSPTSKPAMCLKHIVGRIEKTGLDEQEGFSRFMRKFRGKKK